MAAELEAFHEFLAALERDRPQAFVDCARLLYMIRNHEAPMGLSPGSGLLLAPFALEKVALRGQASAAQVPPAEVLVSFFPGRQDYLALLAPVVAELQARGHTAAVALPPQPGMDELDFGTTPTFGLHALATPQRYAQARGAFAELKLAKAAFAEHYRLDHRQRAYLSIVLQVYCWQRVLFEAALRQSGARLVFGIHFMLHPGLRGAIRAVGDTGFRPHVVFMQHGVFVHRWPMHDFHGADRVLLWSEESESELSAIAGPKPAATVVGNPKLSVMRAQQLAARRSAETAAGVDPGPRRQRVLVLGTNGSDERDQEALLLAAEGLPETSQRDVVFRPHPAEPAARYQALVERGLLRPHQIERDADVYRAVARADVVVGTQSTLMIEAIALGIAAVQLLPDRFETNWSVRGMASASEPQELRHLMERLQHDAGALELLLATEEPLAEAVVGPVEGAVRRSADALEEVLATAEAPGQGVLEPTPSQGPAPTSPAPQLEPAARAAPALGPTRSAIVPPLVTIMIPTYGQADILPTAIDSALAQDYGNLEVVVADDASPDDTTAVVQRYANDARLRYVRRDTNLGRTQNYRTTLAQDARGSYVLNLDGDDWLSDPSYLSSAMTLVSAHPELALVFARSRTYREDSDSYLDDTTNAGLPEVCDGTELFLRYPEGTVSIPHLTALYRRDIALQLGFYQHDVIGSDSVAMLLMLPGHRIGFLDRVVGVWRLHANNATWISSVASRRANFVVADLPSTSPAVIGQLDARSLRRWRYRMSVRLGHQALADSIVHGRPAVAALLLLDMLRDRPAAAWGSVARLAKNATRRLRSPNAV